MPKLYTFCRFKKAGPLKTKLLAVRRKTSPAVPPPTPPVTKPASAEGPSALSKLVEPSRPRAMVTPASEWMSLTGKVNMPPPQDRAEAMAHDAPVLHPIKEEAFDEDGRIKLDFQDRFIPAPCFARKKGTTFRDDEPGQSIAYDTYDVIDVLEDRYNSFAESFEVGISILRQHYQVCKNPPAPLSPEYYAGLIVERDMLLRIGLPNF